MARDKNGRGEDKVGMGKAAFIMFTVLVLASASVMTVAVQEASPRMRDAVIIDADGILRALLAGTIEYASYTDSEGQVHYYDGWTTQALLVRDLEIRANETLEPNLEGLAGLESNIDNALKDLSSPHHYNLKVSIGPYYFKISDLEVEGKSKASTTFYVYGLDSDAIVSLSLTT